MSKKVLHQVYIRKYRLFRKEKYMLVGELNIEIDKPIVFVANMDNAVLYIIPRGSNKNSQILSDVKGSVKL